MPVPEPVAYTDDETVTGAQFYAMGWVEGRSLYTAAETSEHLSRGGVAGRTGPSFIDTLAALHALDPDAIGLGDLGKRDVLRRSAAAPLVRVVERIEGPRAPGVDRLHTFLVDHLPEQAR